MPHTTLPPETGQKTKLRPFDAASMLLFAFDLSGLLNIFASKFSKPILRFNVG
jgi:hypothetical protein